MLEPPEHPPWLRHCVCTAMPQNLVNNCMHLVTVVNNEIFVPDNGETYGLNCHAHTNTHNTHRRTRTGAHVHACISTPCARPHNTSLDHRQLPQAHMQYTQTHLCVSLPANKVTHRYTLNRKLWLTVTLVGVPHKVVKR